MASKSQEWLTSLGIFLGSPPDIWVGLLLSLNPSIQLIALINIELLY